MSKIKPFHVKEQPLRFADKLAQQMDAAMGQLNQQVVLGQDGQEQFAVQLIKRAYQVAEIAIANEDHNAGTKYINLALLGSLKMVEIQAKAMMTLQMAHDRHEERMEMLNYRGNNGVRVMDEANEEEQKDIMAARAMLARESLKASDATFTTKP